MVAVVLVFAAPGANEAFLNDSATAKGKADSAFIAFVRINGETQTFTRMCDLLCWIHGIERADNSSTQETEG
ncbi:MAG: hypothetical protein II350_03425, partial [Clostridia bacterium]|nr:hypothetical protein [Clostridia bacterium]